MVYGYGRWSQGAIRQWLNSEAAAGAWWTPQNPWDRPPAYANARGFLAGCSADFLAILAPVDVVTALNTQEGFQSDTETTRDRIFLPCLENWYISPEKSGEGEEWDYYKALAQQAGLAGKFQRSQTYEILKKYRVDSTTSAVTVWLRSCVRGYASNAWFVNSSGYVSNNSAYYGTRGCPACKILKSS